MSLCGPHFCFRPSCWISIAGHVTCHVTVYIEIQLRLIYDFCIENLCAKNDPGCCSMAFLLIIEVRLCCWLLYYDIVAGYCSVTVLPVIVVRHCCWVLFHDLSHSEYFLMAPFLWKKKTERVISTPTSQRPFHVLTQALKFLCPKQRTLGVTEIPTTRRKCWILQRRIK